MAGAGLLYIIGLDLPFSPASIECRSIDREGSAWTYGEPGVGSDHLYVRSQKELPKFTR